MTTTGNFRVCSLSPTRRSTSRLFILCSRRSSRTTFGAAGLEVVSSLFPSSNVSAAYPDDCLVARARVLYGVLKQVHPDAPRRHRVAFCRRQGADRKPDVSLPNDWIKLEKHILAQLRHADNPCVQSDTADAGERNDVVYQLGHPARAIADNGNQPLPFAIGLIRIFSASFFEKLSIACNGVRRSCGTEYASVSSS